MEFATSRDGTPIAYSRDGDGPPLVLVHGTTADHTRWAPVQPELARHFTVMALDRRGRGSSGDVEHYAIEREYEDVMAVLDAAGDRVNLLGHSFGALCALEAALGSPHIDKLVLYEPVFSVGGSEVYPPDIRQNLERLLEQGDNEGLLTVFFRDLVGMADDEISVLKSEPAWGGRLAAAHTIVREMADGDYVFDASRVQELAAPTLLLVGENSPPALRNPTETLAKALPDARTKILSGQAHVAMSKAPDLFVREVLAFLTA